MIGEINHDNIIANQIREILSYLDSLVYADPYEPSNYKFILKDSLYWQLTLEDKIICEEDDRVEDESIVECLKRNIK